MPFDPYGGAIYIPAIVNGDSAWLMFDTGLSRTGLDRDWAKSAGATPVADTGATVVLRSLRLGDLRLELGRGKPGRLEWAEHRHAAGHRLRVRRQHEPADRGRDDDAHV